MKKYRLQDKTKDAGSDIVGTFDTIEDADLAARDYIDNQACGVTIFDMAVLPIEVTDACDNVKTYEDAYEALGVDPIDELAMAAAGFRPDEIARRKLETITAALNEGWKPDWNDKSQAKYVPWFWIEPQPGQTLAGLACAIALDAPSSTSATLGSRLCFKNARIARYAAEQFTDLYALILVENY